MNPIGKKIIEVRKLKGITQEELAELSNVNLRTIQRIENNESEPRSKTLSLICEVLQIDLEDVLISDTIDEKIGIGDKIVHWLFLIILNMVLVAIISFLTMDSFANFNSRFASFLLSVFIPFFIVFLTKRMNAMERMLKFGIGMIATFILTMFLHGFPTGWMTGLFGSMMIFLTVLYFGRDLIKNWDRE